MNRAVEANPNPETGIRGKTARPSIDRSVDAADVGVRATPPIGALGVYWFMLTFSSTVFLLYW